MNRPKISISIDPELLERIDRVAEARGESRSATIEAVLKGGVETQEEFLRDLENPIWRAVYGTVLKPSVAMAIAKVVGEGLSPKEAAEMHERVTRLSSRAKERQNAKKTGQTSKRVVEGA